MDVYGSPIGETVPFPLRVANRGTALEAVMGAKNLHTAEVRGRAYAVHHTLIYFSLIEHYFFMLSLCFFST